MWIYKQSTGELFRGGAKVAIGYSGAGPHKNKPEDERLAFQGPIPAGRYEISAPFHSDAKGPVVMHLHPVDGQEMHGRGGFLIHGDSIAAPGTASHGCIILPRPVRLAIGASGDAELEVIA